MTALRPRASLRAWCRVSRHCPAAPPTGRDSMGPPPRPPSCLSAQPLLLLQGIFISRVSEEGPAARAGVRVGDKLLEVGQGPPLPPPPPGCTQPLLSGRESGWCRALAVLGVEAGRGGGHTSGRLGRWLGFLLPSLGRGIRELLGDTPGQGLRATCPFCRAQKGLGTEAMGQAGVRPGRAETTLQLCGGVCAVASTAGRAEEREPDQAGVREEGWHQTPGDPRRLQSGRWAEGRARASRKDTLVSISRPAASPRVCASRGAGSFSVSRLWRERAQGLPAAVVLA